MTRNTGFMVGVRGGSANFVSLNPDTQPLPACFQGAEARKQGAGCYPFVFVNQDDGLPVACGNVGINSGRADCEKFNPASGKWEKLGNWNVGTGYCGIGAFHPEVGLIVASGWGSKVVTRSTDYGVTFERLADAPVQLDANQAALTIADEDSIFLGPGTNRQADPQENGEFYKFSLSANTWTKMATFPKDYYMAECTLWQRAPDFEKEIYCLGSRDQHLMIYNVARDEWRELKTTGTRGSMISGATLFTYEDELYVVGGYGQDGYPLRRLNGTTLKWEETGIRTTQHYHYSNVAFVDDICP